MQPTTVDISSLYMNRNLTSSPFVTLFPNSSRIVLSTLLFDLIDWYISFLRLDTMPPKTSKSKGPKPPPAGLARYPYKCPVHKQSWSSQSGLANHLGDIHTLALQRGVPCTNWLVIPPTIPDFNSVPFLGLAGGPPGGFLCTPFAAPGPPPTFRGIPNPVVPQIGLMKWQAPPWAEGLDGKKPKKDDKKKPKEKPESVPVGLEQV
jgi:hypothetical protein